MAVVPMSVMPMVMAWFVCFVVTTSQKDEAIVNALKNKKHVPFETCQNHLPEQGLESTHTCGDEQKTTKNTLGAPKHVYLSRRPIGGAGDPLEHRQLLEHLHTQV